MSQPTHRVITPEQKRDGYVEKIGNAVFQREYFVLKRLEDGNYLVREPQPEKPLYRIE